MVEFSTVKPGDILYDCRRTRMGNTTMSRMGTWPVKIISVDAEQQTVMASWNYNAPKKMYAAQLRRLRRTPYKPPPHSEDKP